MSDPLPGMPPEDEQALGAAVNLWAQQNNSPVSARARLQQLQMAQARTVPLKVSPWPAVLVACCMAAMLGLAIAWGGAGATRPRIIAEPKRTTAGDPLVAGTVDETPTGLFRRGAAQDEVWTAFTPKGKCFDGDWIQNASELDSHELSLSGKRSVQLSPATLIRVRQDGEKVGIELWRGTIMAWGNPEHPLNVLQVKADRTTALFHLLKGKNEAGYFCVEANDERSLKIDGYLLLDEGKLRPLPIAALKDHPHRKPQSLSDSSANLLKLAQCSFENKPVSEIVESLQQSLGVKIRLSTDAAARVSGQSISFHANDMTAAELLGKLAARLKLNLRVVEGEVEFELPPGEKAAPRAGNDF